MDTTYGPTPAAIVLHAITEISDKSTRRKVARTVAEFHRTLHHLKYIPCVKCRKKLALLVFNEWKHSIVSNTLQLRDDAVKSFTLNVITSAYRQFINQIDTSYSK